MNLWVIKYMDVDERWWIDIALREQEPGVRYTAVGSSRYCDGFDLPDAGVLVRKASVAAGKLSDWPTDEAVRVKPTKKRPTP